MTSDEWGVGSGEKIRYESFIAQALRRSWWIWGWLDDGAAAILPSAHLYGEYCFVGCYKAEALGLWSWRRRGFSDLKLFLASGPQRSNNRGDMKKIALFALLVFGFSLPSAMAWVGGPWSNNGFSPGAETGTYQAVATMSNGSGIMRFEVTNQPSLSINENTSLWWYRGATYVGNTSAVVDLTSRIVTGINTASTLDQGVIEDQAAVIDTAGKNVEHLTANWHAKIRTVAPQIRFDGQGTVQLFGDVDTGTRTRIFNVQYFQGEVLDNGNFLYDIIINTDNSTMVSSFGQDPDFPQLGSSVKMKVWGSRTSWVAAGNILSGGQFVRTNGLLTIPGESAN
ncbi:MAG: hypothetical protein AAGD22_11580 [Verrucomicrobiota bacterium]